MENSEHEDGKEVENGKSFAWASGENIVTITVTDNAGQPDESVTIYVITVTKQ